MAWLLFVIGPTVGQEFAFLQGTIVMFFTNEVNQKVSFDPRMGSEQRLDSYWR